MVPRRVLLGCLASALVAAGLNAAAPACAQVPVDPLSRDEGDALRDTADKLDQRVKLLLQFATARITTFTTVRDASPRPPGRDDQLYGLLRQYRAILPEFDDAVDDMSSQPKQYKVAKVLDEAIAGLQALATTLQHIQASSTPADMANYHFILQDCVDTTSESLQNAQQARAQAGKPSPAAPAALHARP